MAQPPHLSVTVTVVLLPWSERRRRKHDETNTARWLPTMGSDLLAADGIGVRVHITVTTVGVEL